MRGVRNPECPAEGWRSDKNAKVMRKRAARSDERAAPQAMRKSKLTRQYSGIAFIAPFFIVFFLFELYPIVYSFILSFAKWDGYASPEFVGLANYGRLVSDPFFLQSVGNTFIIWIISIVPQLSIALVLAIIMNERWFRHRNTFRAIYFFPNIVTPVTVGVLFKLLFDEQSGGVNRLLMQLGVLAEPVAWIEGPVLSRLLVGLIMCWQWFGFNAIIYLTGLQTVPEEFYDAAAIDGASAPQIALRITIPLIWPVIFFTIIMSVIGGMQIFDVPLMLQTGTNSDYVSTMVVQLFSTAFRRYQYGYGAAMAYGIFLLVMVMSIISAKLFRRKGANS